MAGLDRDSVSSWLSGPRAAASSQGIDIGYPGERLGRPEAGPGSVTGWGRRFAALFVDWLVALGITAVVLPRLEPSSYAHSLAVLVVFGLTTGILAVLQHASFGQRVLGLRLIPVGDVSRSPWWLLVRALLVALVIPALVYDRDRRGVPDHVARSVLVRVR
jgi:hypothetical protein